MAAAEIDAAGGEVVKTEPGFAVEVPERVIPPSGPGDWVSAGLEGERRGRLGLCGETLAVASSTVIAAPERAEASKGELAVLLADAPPILG
jgi:hypothetical protein